MTAFRTRTFALLAGGLFLGGHPIRGEEADRPVDFAREVLPVLSNKCFACHGPDAKEKELRLDSYEGATADRGGYRAVDPDDPSGSEALARIHDPEDPMPPADAEKALTDAERELLGRWIRQGGAYAIHWAFVPPQRSAGEGEDIDHHIARPLAERGLEPAGPADPATLARRAALVLTGLPPEAADLETYLANPDEAGYGRLVDALLASPRYGEHQARYWLDAVRYGDTHGLHLDNRRGIYPYRDWVVHAINRNQPLDEFITWQLAGDLLPGSTVAQRVATGYVRMNPTTAEGGVLPEEFQAKNNFDRVETLGTVFLGMSLSCARCHTHKYDPIPQEEYYRLMAFFNSTSEKPLDGNSYTYGPVLKAPEDQGAWQRWTGLETERARLLAAAEATLGSRPEWRDGDAGARLALLAASEDAAAAAAADLRERMAAAEKSFTTTLVTADLETPRETRILQRGEYNLPSGSPLEPGVISVMGDLPSDLPRNRLGLARWLTSPDHPLVARVLVNRLWQRVFGAGLVRTPEDFGLQGEQPTHPELLDWLAVELRESGWDLRHMLRLMVTSRTFRQSSAFRADIDDPENRLWARGPAHRLDAEVLRDIGLWSSLLLDPHMGGEGVKPYQPAGMWLAMAHPASNTKKYERDKGERLYRRSLYVYWKRTSPHPMMTLFDAPNRESSCVQRSRTNTALQSLGLLNETQRLEMARGLAQRLLLEAADDGARIDRAFTLLACRPAHPEERAACLGLLAEMRERYRADPESAAALLDTGEAPRDESLDAAEHAAWTQLAVTVLASDIAILLY